MVIKAKLNIKRGPEAWINMWYPSTVLILCLIINFPLKIFNWTLTGVRVTHSLFRKQITLMSVQEWCCSSALWIVLLPGPSAGQAGALPKQWHNSLLRDTVELRMREWARASDKLRVINDSQTQSCPERRKNLCKAECCQYLSSGLWWALTVELAGQPCRELVCTAGLQICPHEV